MPESIECPACRTAVAIRDPRPGRFRIACPTCDAALILAVPDDPTGAVGVVVEGTGPAIDPNPTPAEGSSAAVRPDLVASGRVGRYRVVEPGRGRAWGLGPEVSLTVLRDRWATDPRFVARWFLEALAGTALRHPNLAEPFEVNVTSNRVFAAAVAARSTPLADPTARADLDRLGRVAVVLHAARGLKYAAEQGVHHRDLSLDAIRINPGGLVTVEGIGVGLTPDSAAAPVALIPLAQPGEAAPTEEHPPKPDAQVDVVGLGRVLSTLVAGSSGARAVPPGLATLIRRMVGESGAGPLDPRERFADMGAVVRALEAELGVGGPLNPPAPEAEAFEGAVLDFQTAPLLPLRRWVAPGALVAQILLVLALGGTGHLLAAAGFVAFGGLIGVALAGFRGWEARDRLERRVAPTLAILGRRDLITVGVAASIVGVALVVMHLVATAAIVAALAVGLAAAYHYGLDRPLAQSRDDALIRLRALVRGWRRSGSDEAAIRRYVASSGGDAWEEVFGTLFGSGALRAARNRWGLDLAGGRRPQFAPSQAWLLARWDRAVQGWIDDRTRGLLEPIVERDLEARGMQVLTARRKSKRAAEAVVAVLGQFRRSSDESVGLPLAEALRKAEDRPEEFLQSPEIADESDAPTWLATLLATLAAMFGHRVRFALAVSALAAAAVWMERNELYSFDQVKFAAQTGAIEGDRDRAIAQAKLIGQKFVDGVARVVDAPDEGEPMHLGVVSPEISRHLNGFALLASGLILLYSALLRGSRIIPYAFLGALIPLTPRLVFPSVRPLDPASLVAMGLGLVVFAVGVNHHRGQDD